MDHNAEKPALFSDEDVSAGAHQAILSPTVDSKPEGVTVPPDHPAFIQFTRWLDAFNTVDKQILEEYHSDSRFPYSVAIPNVGFQHLEISLARQTGGFNVVEIVSASSPESLVVVLQAKKELDCAKITIEVDPSKSEYPVTSFMVQLINTPLKYVPENHPRRAEFEKANIPLTAELRRIVVEAVSNEIREQYLDPDSSGEIIEKLSNNLNNGNYEDIEDSSRFAQRLTQDIYLAANNSRMGISFSQSLPGWTEKRGPEPKELFEDLKSYENFGFGTVAFDTISVPGKVVATLPLNWFPPSTKEVATDWQNIQKAIGDILTSVADADALIVDLRNNYGGDPHTVLLVESYFLGGAVPLHSLDFVDREGKITESFFTTPESALPVGTRAFGGSKPIYVLTSKNTAAGGEHVAYDLKEFKRATAVIGEGNAATAGVANSITRPRFICEEQFGKGWWKVLIPSIKPVHEITGTSWERVGVISDVIAGRGEWEGTPDAAEVALILANRALQDD